MQIGHNIVSYHDNFDMSTHLYCKMPCSNNSKKLRVELTGVTPKNMVSQQKSKVITTKQIEYICSYYKLMNLNWWTAEFRLFRVLRCTVMFLTVCVIECVFGAKSVERQNR